MRFLIIFALLTAAALPASAATLPPIKDSAVTKECSACHMAYQPQFLPQASWKKIMENLQDHFGEDASLPDATRKEITKYMLDNAADVSRTRVGAVITRSIGKGPAPLRITDVPIWQRIHWEIPDRIWKDPRVRSKANCQACHRSAGFGYYEED